MYIKKQLLVDVKRWYIKNLPSLATRREILRFSLPRPLFATDWDGNNTTATTSAAPAYFIFATFNERKRK